MPTSERAPNWLRARSEDDGSLRAVLLDLEGTLFANAVALPREAAAVAALREQGLGVRFLTNIDAQPRAKVAAKLARCGLDVLGYATLDGAFGALRAGADLVALQGGRYFRREDGDHLDTGAVVAGLEYSAGVQARVLGKPPADFLAFAARSPGVAVQECVVVGDDATTDIAGGREAGARTVQVRSGKYADQHAEGITGSADATIDSIADLPDLLANGFAC